MPVGAGIAVGAVIGAGAVVPVLGSRAGCGVVGVVAPPQATRAGATNHASADSRRGLRAMASNLGGTS